MLAYIRKNIDYIQDLAKNRINIILVASGYSLTKDEQHTEGIETRSLQWCNQKANHTIQLIWDGKENWFFLGEFDSLVDLNLSYIKEIAIVPFKTTKKISRKSYANSTIDELIIALKEVLLARKKIKNNYLASLDNIAQANSKLTFERKLTGRNPKSFYGTTSYIDFIINGTSLSEILGGIGENIGKFGWKDNLDIEKGELGDLRSSNSTWLENGFHSIYVCSECADEGCGAYMFRIIKKEFVVIWTDFIFGDGYEDTDDNPNENIDIEPLVFDKEEYVKALNELEKLL